MQFLNIIKTFIIDGNYCICNDGKNKCPHVLSMHNSKINKDLYECSLLKIRIPVTNITDENDVIKPNICNIYVKNNQPLLYDIENTFKIYPHPNNKNKCDYKCQFLKILVNMEICEDSFYISYPKNDITEYLDEKLTITCDLFNTELSLIPNNINEHGLIDINRSCNCLQLSDKYMKEPQPK